MWSSTSPTAEIEIFHSDIPTAFGGAQELSEAHRDEVLDFLAERPLGGLFLRGHVEDNGLVSSANRGRFVGVRSPFGFLEGVALIGHATLFEARSETALATLAKAAQQTRTTHMLLGEQRKVEHFWKYYSTGGQQSRASCRELLFKQTEPASDRDAHSPLRLAAPADLNRLLPIHAQLAFDESGTNPLEKDPAGFRERYMRRIRKDRVWVVTEGDRLAFKAEIALQTPDAIYLEGIHVHPTLRGAGQGNRFLSELSRILLKRVHSICLLVNEENAAAQALYRKAGFTLEDYYQTIFLHDDSVN
jgi:ribosomal protein S18 acetylase RimI-like enzyme